MVYIFVRHYWTVLFSRQSRRCYKLCKYGHNIFETRIRLLSTNYVVLLSLNRTLSKPYHIKKWGHCLTDRSPDLSSCYFFLWSFFKEKVYVERRLTIKIQEELYLLHRQWKFSIKTTRVRR